MADWHSVKHAAPQILDEQAKSLQGLESEYNFASFVISDGSVDRHNDIVSPDGMNKSHYNGVVLFNHQHEMPPVGKAVKVWQHDGQVKAVQQFVPRDVYEFAGLVYDLYKGGFMTDTSIGFDVIDAEINEKRTEKSGMWSFDIKQWELLEFSNVTIGANRNARVIDVKAFEMAKAAGIDVEEASKWADELLQKDLVSNDKLRLQYIDMYRRCKKYSELFIVPKLDEKEKNSASTEIKSGCQVSKTTLPAPDSAQLFTETELANLQARMKKELSDG